MKQLFFAATILCCSQPLLAQNNYPASGNVGIGTNNPQTALQIGEQFINNENNVLTFPGVYNFEKLHLGQGGNGSNFIEFINHASLTHSYSAKMGTNVDRFGNGLYIQVAPAASSHGALVYGDNPGIFINASNQVAIGTNNTAGYKLAVAGNMIATKVKVKAQNNWPDFVFEPLYKLPSLQELESFIKENKHLPDMPSAKEVSEQGIDLGENQAKLLQKIEELTLYIIDQNKKLEAVQQQLKDLQHKK
ncbi:hypothetical protein [Chitinophaga niabensis]|uniref:Uncharacterized protein n=1 Tax=Chitinophaga niabensis TaxID=536979 RepID=A0A1N6K6Y0_9BACT|nr:hypothetical protein [Chitinophaga niabensis]SIO52076.1 hypothetical protein SAMN04488055_5163 [Chitinophaga niabensis]